MSQRMNFSIDMGNQSHNSADSSSKSQQLTFVVLGDFTETSASPELEQSSQVSLLHVDQDNFDTVMTRLKPTLKLNLSGLAEPLYLSFESLDDFHPQQLYERLSCIHTATVPIVEEHPSPSPSLDKETDRQTLDRLLGDQSLLHPAGQASPSPAKKRFIQSVVENLLKDSLQAEIQGTRDQYREGAEQLTPPAAPLRELLHHPSFQTLESQWRGLEWLLRNLQTDERVQLYLANLNFEAWRMDLLSNQDITSTALYRTLYEQLNDQLSSVHKLVLICEHIFTPLPQDLLLLEKLGQLTGSFDARLITGANDDYISAGESSSVDLNSWKRFHQNPGAERITLVVPRILLRLPYGQQYDPIEAFAFEELDQDWSSTDLLWGNPAYALAIQLAMGCQSNRSSQHPLLMDCPAFAYKRNEESHLQPCTEHLFTEPQMEQLLELGIVPVIGSRRHNSIQIPWYP
jgi:type VI secretion system ImpC/EvpB family protein